MHTTAEKGQAAVTKPASSRRSSATSSSWGVVRDGGSRRSEWLRFPTLLIWGVLAVLTLGSCAGLGRTIVEVEMDDGSWTVTPAALGDEELSFSFTNKGSQAHRPVVILTGLDADGLPEVDGRVDLANIHIVWPLEGEFAEWPPEHGTDDLFAIVDPGQTVEGAPRAPGEGNPGFGTYVVFCYTPSHYEHGEFGSFELTEDGS